MADTFVRLGRYELLEQLGAGRAFDVFKARSFGVEGFEKKLVVKRVRQNLAQDPHFVQVFVEEAQRAVRLGHANVVQVFDLGHDDDSPEGPIYFMASEYVPGLDFAALLERVRVREPVPPELVLYVAAEVAKALDYAHRRRDDELNQLGIVHGAVSAREVLLSWEGDVKLSDFGMSRPLLAASPAAAGSLETLYAFLSPEQVEGKPAIPQSDVFSLALMVYSALTGTDPFVASTAQQTLERVNRAEVPPLSTFRDDLPPLLSDVLGRAMSRKLRDRMAEASTLHDQLVDVLRELGTSFGAIELSGFVERYRDAPRSGPPPRITSLMARPVSDQPPAEAPAEPHRPSLPPLVAFADTRHASVLVVRYAGRVPPVALLTRVRDVANRYGADAYDTAPGELRALFGLRRADGLDAEMAVRAALVISRVLATGAVRVATAVASGRVSLEQALDEGPELLYDEARALLSEGEGLVIVTTSVASQLRDRFELSRTTTAYAVARPGRPRGAWDRFVGRKQELGVLAEVLTASSRGAPRVVSLTGEQGIGKSRLVEEVRRRLARGDMVLATHLIACPPRGSDTKMSGVATMLRRLCGVSEGDPAERIQDVVPRLRALGLAPQEVDAVVAELEAGGASQSAAVLQAAVLHMFQSLARDRFHVFAWDDAQNLDEASVELLRGVAAALGGARVTLIFAGRDDSAAPWRTLPFDAELSLTELSEEDAGRLIALRLEIEEVPEDVARFIIERAGGHPMLIEELVRGALELGGIVAERGRVQQFSPELLTEVPRTLRALVAGRLHRLAGFVRDVAVAMSVLDSPANTDVLAPMMHAEADDVEQAVDVLESAHLVRRLGASSVEFTSPLVPEVIQAELDEASFAELHQHAADGYQVTFAEQIEEEAARIGYHLASAGYRDRAADMYATSALHHLSHGRLIHGVSELVYALDLADLTERGGPQIGNWVRALSSAVRHVRTGPDLPAFVGRLVDAVQQSSFDRRIRVQVAIDLALILGALHLYREAEDVLERFAADAEKWPQAIRALLAARGEMAAEQGDIIRAAASLQRASQLRPGDAVEQHRILLATAYAYAAQGEHDEAAAALDSADDLAPSDDLVLSAQRRRARAHALRCEHKYGDAAEMAYEAALEASEAGLSYEHGASTFAQGLDLLRMGDADRALVAFETALTSAEQIGVERLIAECSMALSYLGAGSDPVTELTEARRLAVRNAWTSDALLARWFLARYLAESGDVEGARRQYSTAMKEAQTAGQRVFASECEEEREALG